MREKFKKIAFALSAVVLFIGALAGIDYLQNNSVNANAATALIKYQTHVQSYGWQAYVSDKATSGTTGKGKRLEAIKIKLNNQAYTGSVQYRTHVQSYGWQNWVSDGAMSGTSGESKRLEAIQIKLTGTMATKYDVYYRVHAQSYGWLGWAKNGESAGTSGYSKRLEAIQIVLVAKGGAAPGTTTGAYMHPLVKYQSHIQSYGWLGLVKDGETTGTIGQSKRMEAVKISLNEADYTGSIQYRTHVQTYGWQSWVSDGAMAGTSGQSKRVEAIEIKLTGTMATKYDVYYRAYSQGFGWLGWAKNGASAGTSGYSYRLEALQVVLVAKGGSAPGSTTGAYKEKVTTVAATGITLSSTTANLAVNGTKTLTATVAPTNATNKTVTWTSSNTSVATVSNGKITAKAAGTATITAKTSNGKTATCKVTVKAASDIVGTDTDQGDEKELYEELFDINSKIKIDMDITDDQLEAMEADFKAGDEDTFRKVNVTFTINGKEYKMYEVGVKLKGNTSRVDVYSNNNTDDRNLIHFKLKFTETFDGDEYGDDAKVWASDELRDAREDRTFATLEGLELKWNRNLDQTYVANTYVNQMYRAFGVYAQNTSLSQVVFGGYNYGVYTMYEPVDKVFLKKAFGKEANDGDLYKCQWGQASGTGSWSGANYSTASLNSIGVEEAGKTWTYVLKTNKKKSDKSSLKNLITALNQDSSKATFEKYVDADNFVMYAAVAYFAGNPDDLRNNYNNHFIYFNNDNGLAYIIPYDNDRVFGMTTGGHDMTEFGQYDSNTALQGSQSNPLYNNSVIGRTNNYSSASGGLYEEDLEKVYNSEWLDYDNYLKYYNIAKANYSSVAVPDSHVKAYVKDESKTYSTSLLAFGEGNGKIGSQDGYRTVSSYLTAIKAKYVATRDKYKS